MKLKMLFFLSIMAATQVAQATDYQLLHGNTQPVAEVSKAKVHTASGQLDKSSSQQNRDHYLARVEEEKANGGATPPVRRRMPLNQ